MPKQCLKTIYINLQYEFYVTYSPLTFILPTHNISNGH